MRLILDEYRELNLDILADRVRINQVTVSDNSALLPFVSQYPSAAADPLQEVVGYLLPFSRSNRSSFELARIYWYDCVELTCYGSTLICRLSWTSCERCCMRN